VGAALVPTVARMWPLVGLVSGSIRQVAQMCVPTPTSSSSKSSKQDVTHTLVVVSALLQISLV